MKLENIGFYTLSDYRVVTSSVTSPLYRCELILTARCNFKCPYCRHVGGKDLDQSIAEETIRLWVSQGLKNIRFSGGEPTLYPGIVKLVRLAKYYHTEHIAVSTNGSAEFSKYVELISAGVNDFSISLDACCAEDGDKMAGGVKGSWDKVVRNIQLISKLTYTTVGIVLTDDNLSTVNETIQFAHDLGVADIRVIPAAQDGNRLQDIRVDSRLLDAHPILKYRVENIQQGKAVRGLGPDDPDRCTLVLDDMAVMKDCHYPCIIYMRERGAPIGKVGPGMRAEREEWSRNHDTRCDPICQKNCLDVCVEFNRRKIELTAQRSTKRNGLYYA